MLQLQSAFGVLALLAIAWGLGENRRAVSLRQAAIGLAVTVATAVVLLKLPVVARAFGAINDAVGAISAASRAGTSFVFGYIGGGALPFELKNPGKVPVNHVRKIYEPFAAEEISRKITQLVSPKPNGWKGEIEIIFSESVCKVTGEPTGQPAISLCGGPLCSLVSRATSSSRRT